MNLKRLRLENFRQHRDSTFEFGPGMTAIVGPNGSGKTTVLEAITYALYGRQRNNKDSIRYYWAEPRSKCRVVLDFDFDGRSYVLERSERDASLEDVTEGLSVTRASGLTAVDREVGKLLRLSYDQFKNSFCAEQKSLAFLQFQSARKQEQVAKMLGLDRLRGAADLARAQASAHKQVSNLLAATLGDPDELASNLQNAQKVVNAATKEVEGLSKTTADLEKQLQPAKVKAEIAEKWLALDHKATAIGQRADGLKSAVTMADTALQAALKDESRWLELKPQQERYVALDAELKNLEVIRHAYLDQKRDQEELTRQTQEQERQKADLAGRQLPDIAVLEAALTAATMAAETALKELNAGVERWRKEQTTAAAVRSKAETDLQHAETALVRADELIAKGVCPECGQPTSGDFASTRAVLAKARDNSASTLQMALAKQEKAEQKPKELLSLEAEALRANDALKQADAGLQSAKHQHAEAKGISQQIEVISTRVDQLQKKLTRIVKYDEAAHKSLSQEHASLKEVHHECLRLAQSDLKVKEAKAALEAAQKIVDEAKTQYRSLKEECKALPIKSEAEAVEARVAYQALTSRLNESSIALARAESSVAAAKQNLAVCEEKLARFKESEEKIRQARSLALLNEVAAKEFGNLRQELNAAILPDLEARASENLALLTNNRYPRLVLDEDFNATIIDDEETKKAVISGGEEDVVALALRLALSELIQERQGRPMSLLILDEVFGSLDPERRQAVLERLHALQGRFDQVLVISHIEEINHVADQCIFLQFDPATRSTKIGDQRTVDDLVLM